MPTNTMHPHYILSWSILCLHSYFSFIHNLALFITYLYSHTGSKLTSTHHILSVVSQPSYPHFILPLFVPSFVPLFIPLFIHRQQVDINSSCPERGFTALIAAVFNKDYEIFDFLLNSRDFVSRNCVSSYETSYESLEYPPGGTYVC